MLGDEAFRLAKEAKNITPDHIPPYNEEQVRLVTQETRYLWTRIEEMIASLNSAESQEDTHMDIITDQPDTQQTQNSTMHLQAGISSSNPTLGNSASHARSNEFVENTNAQSTLYLVTLNRNKRCLLAYHQRRLEFVRSLLWSLHLAPSLVPPQLGQKLSPEEQSYVREYAKLNSAYRDAVESQLCPNDSLDWTANGELPPRDMFIEVRVIRDCGEIVTENGVVNLQAGSQHYLHRSDIEHLITIGYLEHISPC
ncbi:DNA replication protein psf1 [Coemansia asiatica]|uniref:DNA replication complex GINS protein PSF1 n=1 Tax=Coemansia asiatica TaxID=1052880 RepID=A0A9W7XP63_9FUNG|nr:DNA replication protein psf1 [Coemansia asiatica]KAJ2855779.1 DNA replication protein psf1 [Coemansia asiatica]